MSVLTLSACLQHSLCLQETNQPVIAGLSCEQTETFLSLNHILSLSDPRQQKLVFAVELEVPPPLPPPRRSWWQAALPDVFAYAVIPVTAIYMLNRHAEKVTTAAANVLGSAYNVVIEWPLQELYRTGPWFLGWEGESMAAICARITYHGDQHFWERNSAECQRIFAAKEQAWMRLARPLLYVTLLGVTVTVVRLLLREWKRHVVPNRPRQHVDRDMAELYRAFHVILRQILQQQQLRTEVPAQQPQQRHRT